MDDSSFVLDVSVVRDVFDGVSTVDRTEGSVVIRDSVVDSVGADGLLKSLAGRVVSSENVTAGETVVAFVVVVVVVEEVVVVVVEEVVVLKESLEFEPSSGTIFEEQFIW